MNWREASSAPKTGEHLLVSNVGRGDFGTCGGKTQDMAAVVHWWDVADEEGFYLSNGYPHQEADEWPITFTHWVPLESLAAPSAAARAAASAGARARQTHRLMWWLGASATYPEPTA
jgi:hypothetical protein